MDPEPSSAEREGIPPWAGWAGALVLLALAAAAVIPTLGSVRHQEGSDEGYYLRYAATVAEGGLPAFRSLFDGHLERREDWIFPNPLRVLTIGVSALWVRLFGASFESLSSLSLASHLAWILANFALARRALGELRGLWIAALCASSPVLLALSRHALMDGLAALTLALALWTFLALLRPGAGGKARVLFALAFAAAILTKETGVLMVVPFAACLLHRRWRSGSWGPIGRDLAALAAPIVLGALVWLLCAGGVEPLLRLARIVLESPATNEYARRYGAGPWYRYVIDFLAVSPWPTLLALASLGALALRELRREADPALVQLALCAAGMLLAFAFFTKNLRYVLALQVPLAALSASFLLEALKGSDRRRAAWIGSLAVALLCWADWRTFQEVFVERGLYDPVSWALLGARGIVPLR